MILGLKWLCILVVNYQRQHYVLKFNSINAGQCDAIARPCYVIQEIRMFTSKLAQLVVLWRTIEKTKLGSP